LQLCVPVAVCRDGRAEEQVRVASDCLGGAVDDDVCAYGQRALEKWCAQRVVDHAEDPAFAGEGA